MESVVPSSDDPNNQLAFVQQLVSQLSVGGGNPITINVVAGDIVQTQQNNNQNVQGDYNNNSIKTYNNNNNNDNSKNILTKEYFDEKVAILSEALTDLDKKIVNLSEGLTDVKAEQLRLSLDLNDIIVGGNRFILQRQRHE